MSTRPTSRQQSRAYLSSALAFLAWLAVTNAFAWLHYDLTPSRGYVGSKFWIQWGNASTSSDNEQTFSFPTPFPTACVYVGVNLMAENMPYQFSVESWTKSNFTIDRKDVIDGTYQFTWMAIGYNASAPDNLGDIYDTYLLGVNSGYVRLNTMEWQWGKNTSHDDGDEWFWVADNLVSANHLGHAGLNLKEGNVQTQLSLSDVLATFDYVRIEKIIINRDNVMDGDNSFVWHMFTVNPHINFSTPSWEYENWVGREIVANMSGLWVQTEWYISDTNGVQYFALPYTFPNGTSHIGINQWTYNYKLPLTASGFNRTHFWINRSNQFTPDDDEVPFSMIAIGT